MIDSTIKGLRAIADSGILEPGPKHHIEKAIMMLQCGQQGAPDFICAWGRMQNIGYQYGSDALEQVKLGFELRGLFK